MRHIKNISKFLTLFFALSFYSCNHENIEEIALDLNLNFANETTSINDLGAFKVIVKSVDASEIFEASNCIIPKDITSHQDRSVGFNLKSGNYRFEFQGFNTNSCENVVDWIGYTDAEVDSSKTNNISILVTQKGGITLSTLTLPAHNAFFSVVKNGDNFVIMGGTNLIYTRLNRVGALTTSECASTECVCSGDGENKICNSPITPTECIEQGMDSKLCNTCLQIKEYKFVEPDGVCLTPCLNSFDKNCSLHGSSNIIQIEPSKKQAKFIQLAGNTLKLPQAKIGHNTISINGKFFIIGGATLSQIEKQENSSLLFSMSEYSDINYTHLMISDLSSTFETININELKDSNNNNRVFYDSVILPFDDKFIISGGNLSSQKLSMQFSCDIYSKNCTKISDSNSPFAGATFSKNNEGGYVVLGGDLDNPFSIDNDANTTLIDTEDTYPNLYKAKMFYSDRKYYVLGGLLSENGNLMFNTKLYIYNNTFTKIGEHSLNNDGSDILSTSTLYEIEEYKHGDDSGFIIVGGLEKKNSIYEPKTGLYFVKFSDFSVIKLGDLNKGRFGHSVFVDSDNKIWVVGGIIASDNKLELTNSIEIYTPQ